MLNPLSLPPIQRGLLVLLASSAVFPVIGVWILRLNLLPYRFMLMHGALLGGALAAALNTGPLPLVIVVNLSLVLAADLMANKGRMDAGAATMALMIASLGGGMAILYSARVPAQEVLGFLWGSMFSISPEETVAVILFSFGLMLFFRAFYFKIQAVLFDRDIAFAVGVDDVLIIRMLLIITALAVAFAMKFMGALLLDALLLLPAIIASATRKSLAGLYKSSVLIGFGLSVVGFLVALIVDIPVGAVIAVLGAIVLMGVLVFNKMKGRRNFE